MTTLMQRRMAGRRVRPAAYIPPLLVSATIPASGATIALVFSLAASGTEETGWTITASGGAVTVSSGAGSGTSSWTLTLSRTIEAGETVTLDYAPGDVANASLGTPLAAFSGEEVTNNSQESAASGDAAPILANPSPVAIRIVSGNSIDFTPTLSAGDAATYSATNLPTGASINSSTGQITGTLSTTGKWTVPITAVNSYGSDRAYVVVTVAGSPTTIDASWKSTNAGTYGGPPYFLPTAGVYVLGENVTTDGTAFVAGANGITLDLNGYTITYDNADQPTVNNTGFETQGASASLAANWDNSSGANILRISRTQYGMWGSYTMQATGFTGTQYILSDAISLPDANQRYQAWCFCRGSESATVSVSVVDASTESVLATGNSSAPQRGFPARVIWDREDSTTSVKLKISVTLTNASQNIFLDFAGLRRADEWGISATGFVDWPPQLESLFSSSQLNKGAGFSLIDTVGGGAVVQGKRSYKGHAICADTNSTLTVAGYSAGSATTLSTNGMDSAAVWGAWSGGAHIDTVDVTCDAEAVQRRMDLIAAVHYNSCGSNITVRHCTFTGEGFVPIACVKNSGPTGQVSNILIEKNTFDGWYSWGTDGYCIVTNGIKDSIIRRNKGVTANARGILMDGFNASSSINVVVGADDYEDDAKCNAWWGDPSSPAGVDAVAEGDGNFFIVQERANLEYPDRLGMETTALRLRYENSGGGPHENIQIIGNHFEAVTTKAPDASLDTDKWNWAAVGGRATHNAQAESASYIYARNTFKATVTEKDTGLSGTRPSTAIAFCFSDYNSVPTAENTYYQNIYESNHIAIAAGENDSYGVTHGTHNLVDCTIAKSADGDATMTFQSYRVGDWNAKITELGSYSTTYTGGATEAIAWGGPATATPLATSVVVFGSRLTVTVDDGADPIEGATVTCDDDNAVEQFSGLTDASGQVVAPLPRVTWTHNGSSPSSVASSPYDISASADGYTPNSSDDFSLTADDSETISLTAV